MYEYFLHSLYTVEPRYLEVLPKIVRVTENSRYRKYTKKLPQLYKFIKSAVYAYSSITTTNIFVLQIRSFWTMTFPKDGKPFLMTVKVTVFYSISLT